MTVDEFNNQPRPTFDQRVKFPIKQEMIRSSNVKPRPFVPQLMTLLGNARRG
jgi:hypothetical protein